MEEINITDIDDIDMLLDDEQHDRSASGSEWLRACHDHGVVTLNTEDVAYELGHVNRVRRCRGQAPADRITFVVRLTDGRTIELSAER